MYQEVTAALDTDRTAAIRRLNAVIDIFQHCQFVVERHSFSLVSIYTEAYPLSGLSAYPSNDTLRPIHNLAPRYQLDMASEEYFRSVPPFPDDVPTAPIPTISLADLHSGNTVAAKCLLRACENLGFFLLDLRGDKLGEAVVNEVDSLFGVAKDIMNLPDEVKAKYPHDVPKSFLGYDSAERFAVPCESCR